MALNKKRQVQLIGCMKSWRTFHPIVSGLNTEEIEFLLEHERGTRERATFIARLESRLSRARNDDKRRSML